MSVTFSPDSKIIAAGSIIEIEEEVKKPIIEIWNWKFSPTEKKDVFVREKTPMDADGTYLAFSRDSKFLASSNGNSEACSWLYDDEFVPNGITITRMSDKKVLKNLKLMDGNEKFAVHSIAFSPDKRYLAAGLEDHTIVLWNASGNFDVKEIIAPNHTRPVTSLAFSPNSKLLASACSNYDSEKENNIILWDITATTKLGSEVHKYKHPLEETNIFGICSLEFSRDGKFLSYGTKSADNMVVISKVPKTYI